MKLGAMSMECIILVKYVDDHESGFVRHKIVAKCTKALAEGTSISSETAQHIP